MVSGDHVLFDITPNINYWPGFDCPLKHYLANLEKVKNFEVALVLPGHRRLMNDLKKRVEELQQHHQQRLNEIIATLQEGEKTAYEVTPKISWSIKSRDWEDFPPAQKWFAFGEALAHLLFLQDEGKVTTHSREGKIYFSLVS